VRDYSDYMVRGVEGTSRRIAARRGSRRVPGKTWLNLEAYISSENLSWPKSLPAGPWDDVLHILPLWNYKKYLISDSLPG
jgi:hypothetical protein